MAPPHKHCTLGWVASCIMKGSMEYNAQTCKYKEGGVSVCVGGGECGSLDAHRRRRVGARLAARRLHGAAPRRLRVLLLLLLLLAPHLPQLLDKLGHAGLGGGQLLMQHPAQHSVRVRPKNRWQHTSASGFITQAARHGN